MSSEKILGGVTRQPPSVCTQAVAHDYNIDCIELETDLDSSSGPVRTRADTVHTRGCVPGAVARPPRSPTRITRPNLPRNDRQRARWASVVLWDAVPQGGEGLLRAAIAVSERSRALMTPIELAKELGTSPQALRAWLRQTWPRFDPGTRWLLTDEQVQAARQRWSSAEPSQHATPSRDRASSASKRDDSDEAYVLDLLDEILGSPCQRQARFPWLVGDPASSGRRAELPVDGYWPDLRLVVEYRERQHDEPTPFFDKPDTTTVSGVHRGEQRRIYDDRRDREIPAQGLRLLIVRPSDLSADSRGCGRSRNSSGLASRKAPRGPCAEVTPRGSPWVGVRHGRVVCGGGSWVRP